MKARNAIDIMLNAALIKPHVTVLSAGDYTHSRSHSNTQSESESESESQESMPTVTVVVGAGEDEQAPRPLPLHQLEPVDVALPEDEQSACRGEAPGDGADGDGGVDAAGAAALAGPVQGPPGGRDPPPQAQLQGKYLEESRRRRARTQRT